MTKIFSSFFLLFYIVGRFSKSRADQIHDYEDLRAQILDREGKRGKGGSSKFVTNNINLVRPTS